MHRLCNMKIEDILCKRQKRNFVRFRKVQKKKSVAYRISSYKSSFHELIKLAKLSVLYSQIRSVCEFVIREQPSGRLDN